MKPFSLGAACLSLLSAVTSGSAQSTETSHVNLPREFKPPQVFKNANLVHIISLEKNYVKELVNVLIENKSKEPQDEYFVPFSSDQISRVGGFEVKDRNHASGGPFLAEVVDYDSRSNTQYYRVKLPSPIKPGGQQTLGISYYLLSAYEALPAAVGQDDVQFLSHEFSVYASSAYDTKKQKTEVKAASATIPDYFKFTDDVSKTKHPQKSGSKLTYGPFDERPAGASLPATVRFEFNKPVIHVSDLDRDVEVSHWGGNIAVEERYTMYHRGANLTGNFNRNKWTQQQFYNPSTFALKELKVPLHVGCLDPYFTDVIGNVSTSKFHSNKRQALLQLKTRYPLFGGWKYPFTIGWNFDAANYLRQTSTGGYILKMPFLEGPKQDEGTEYENINLRVLLPEGAENVKVYTDLPGTSILKTSVGVHKTYLDTIGRTSITIRARNLVDDFRDRELFISYDTSPLATLRKPLLVFASVMAVYFTVWAVGKIETGFAVTK